MFRLKGYKMGTLAGNGLTNRNGCNCRNRNNSPLGHKCFTSKLIYLGDTTKNRRSVFLLIGTFRDIPANVVLVSRT